MITLYTNGQELLDDNKDLLSRNKYLAVFFYWDGPLLKETDKINYAMRCDNDGGTLLALKVEPFNLLLYGDAACCEELLAYLKTDGYEVKNYLCACPVGDEFMRILAEKYGETYEEALAMDFMEARTVTDPSCEGIETAVESDLDEVVECLERFKTDCNLSDAVNKDHVLKNISSFRVIRRDGRIASMARAAAASDDDMKITDVYTRNEYRGQGMARKLVTNLKNEILAEGKIATLNVDRRNPITNHLYRAIGFVPLFSQGEYRKK